MPEPTPASSDGPAANLPVPVKPPLADENTKEGLEAFTRYWFELFNYGYATNDWTTFDAVTDPGCGTCANIKEEVAVRYGSEGWIVGGAVKVNSIASDFVQNIYGSYNSFVEIEQSSLSYFGSNGILESTSDALPQTVNTSIAVFDAGRWVMLDFGAPEGT
ncbi:hypothetical protein IWX75_001270 [Arthrobacter sp. CAN_A6]